MAKQNFFKRFFSRNTKKTKTIFRAFKAGEQNRLTWDWTQASIHADKDIRDAIDIIRGRARDLTQNNDYAKRFVNLCVMNVVGPSGFQFQSKVVEGGDLFDAQANQIIERAFDDWSKKENCTITGRLNFTDVQKLLIQQAARDGEFFVHLFKDVNSKYGLQLQIIEPEDVPHDYNIDLDNGNFIRLGIEFDKFRKPVAYYLKKNNLENLNYQNYYAGKENYERVSAENIIHCFLQDRGRQSRGVSWLAASMQRIKHLSGYEEAALVNARVGAAKMGFFTSENGVDDYVGDGQDANSNVMVTAEPGTFEQLPPGIKFQSYEPDFPQAQYGDYIKSCLRGISSGLGVSYNLLANDLEGVNYSSIRAGLLDERENWKHLQNWFADNFLKSLFTNFLEMGILNGSIALPMRKFEKFNRPEFIGRRWAWVDPKSDIEAKLLELNSGFTTASQIAAEMGKDLEDIYKDLQKEKDLKLKYNLVEENLNGKE